MWGVSDKFLTALRDSHTVLSQVDVYRDDVLLASGIPITGGTVTVEESSQVRRTLDLSVADIDLDPVDASSLLSPFGTELHVFTGVAFPEGGSELVPLGVFRISSAGRGSWFDEVNIHAEDRGAAIADARFVTPWNTTVGTPVIDEIVALIAAVNPDWEVFDLTNSDQLSGAATYERDRWEAVEQLAKSIGAEVFFNPVGQVIIRDVPDLDTEGVWAVDSGEGGVLEDVSTSLTREGVYNAVVASGDPSGDVPPVTGVAYQTTGDMAWGGPFGKVTRYYASPLLQTSTQAQSAAQAILRRSSGYARAVTPQAISNPALDAGDTVASLLPDGLSSLAVVRTLSVPLGLENAMSIGTRLSAVPVTSDDAGVLS